MSTHAPAGGATFIPPCFPQAFAHFYSRPCGRGDVRQKVLDVARFGISTHAPAGGATRRWAYLPSRRPRHFYSRPCGRGDISQTGPSATGCIFLLTPLREGRPSLQGRVSTGGHISTHAPAGGATVRAILRHQANIISTHAPAGGATAVLRTHRSEQKISTHAPAGGATAIFHKSVMRFCGKLPKDDTVLCLASFGFPRRDPKAVYLAWISCANLPQKCVREGLALKDQGTSCFHEGLASHAFDPVLV